MNPGPLPAAPAPRHALLCSVSTGGWEDFPFPFLLEGFAILAWVLVSCLQMAVLWKMLGYRMDHLDWGLQYRGALILWLLPLGLNVLCLIYSVPLKCGHGCPFPSFKAYYEIRVFVLLITSLVGRYLGGHESQL